MEHKYVRGQRSTVEDLEASDPRPSTWDLRHIIHSFGYAFAGIGAMLRYQRNAQIHVAITTVVIVAAVFFRVSVGEWLALIFAITLVLSLEALNTALEAIVDLASPEFHPLAKRAKDLAAGAVLIGAIGVAIVGVVIFLPRFLALLR